MHLDSVNTARAARLPGTRTATGIAKQPTSGAVAVTGDGLAGDSICNLKHHGGPDQAVYAYGGADYAWWASALGRELLPGTFGENLTIAGLASADWCIGDTFRVGAVLLQVTAPRIPCNTLNVRMDDPGFAVRFREAARPGLYFRVLEPGRVSAGDAVTASPFAGDRVPLLDVFREHYNPATPDALVQRFLAAPIDARTRARYAP